MENYEQKHKEALERAKKFHTPESNNTNLKAVLEHIFPELEESEDEKEKRMLKTIAYKMSQHQPDIFTEEENEWFYAWLEKQGEQKQEVKLIFPKFRVGDRIFKTHNSDINKCGIFLITKITEQGYWYFDSVICAINEEDEWELVLLNTKILQGNVCFGSNPSQRKQEWSEEDEKICNEIIDFFLGDIETRCTTIDKQRHFGYWLKSLKNRAIPSTKQEWSEEDKETLHRVIERIKDLDHYWNKPTDEKMIAWLKSLKPHWKPSEKQMTDLYYAAKQLSVTRPYLQILYNDLKKL